MGVKERRERQKEILRQDILDAARELFVTEGYQNVSMRKVAEKIEYSPTTIYLYFKDKAELLYCLCEETFGKMLANLEAIGSDAGDPLVCLRKGLRAYVDFGLNNPNDYKVALMSSRADVPMKDLSCTQSMGAKTYFLLRTLVAQCIVEKRFRTVDVDTATQGLWATMHGITSLFIDHTDFPFVEHDQLIDHIIDNALIGLTATNQD